MMKHMLILSSLLYLFSSSQIYAQVNQLVPGYLIDQDGNTIKTHIFVGSDRNLYQGVLIKPASGAPILRKEPFEVMGFGFGENQTFEAVAIEDGLFQDSVFVEPVFIGTLSLYKTADEKGKLLFLIKKENGDWTPLPKSAWQSVMKALLSDANDDEMLNEIQSTRYASKPLTHLLSRYQQSIDSEREGIKSSRRHVVISKGIIAGGGPRTALLLGTEALEGNYDGRLFSAGIYARARLTHRLSVRGEVSYQSSSFSQKDEFVIWATDLEVQFSSLAVSGIIEYNAFVSPRMTIYPLVGGGILHNLTHESRRSRYLIAEAQGEWSEWESIDWKKSVEVFAGLGLRYSLGKRKEVFLEGTAGALNAINTLQAGIIDGVNLRLGLGF